MPSLTLVPEDCPIFQTCNAAICPLDPRWPLAVHRWGEPICRYLRASGKEGAAQHYQNDPVFEACQTRLDEVCAKHPDIARGVARASTSPIKGAAQRGQRPGVHNKRD